MPNDSLDKKLCALEKCHITHSIEKRLINKSQCQFSLNVGIYLLNYVFVEDVNLLSHRYYVF